MDGFPIIMARPTHKQLYVKSKQKYAAGGIPGTQKASHNLPIVSTQPPKTTSVG